MMVMPFFMVHVKKLKRKIKAKFWGRDDRKITIDMEYAMILTKFESMIIWCPISPFVLPLTLISTQLNYYFYRKKIVEKQWTIKPFNNNVVIPVYALWFSIVISQCFITLFVFVCIGNEECGFVLAAALIIMDIVSGFRLCYAKRRGEYGEAYAIGLDNFE